MSPENTPVRQPAAPARSAPPATEDAIIAYYTKYYRDELGLADWEQRARRRLDEVSAQRPELNRVLRWIPGAQGERLRSLVVGGGTGAEFFGLSELGHEAHAVEPNPEAVAIAHALCAARELDTSRFREGVGEALPYADGLFDLVWCRTVIEHVQDVRKTIEEMVRVLRPGGWLYLVAPDYRVWYEPHYKIPAPMTLPRPVLRAYFRMRGRPPAFVDTLQLVNAGQVRRILGRLPVTSFQVLDPVPEQWVAGRDRLSRHFLAMRERRGIHKNQEWLVRRHADAEDSGHVARGARP